MSLTYFRSSARRTSLAVMAGLLGLGALPALLQADESPAVASGAPTPLFFFDATNPSSYPGTGSTWFDLSGNASNGALTGPITFDSNNRALNFPGGVNGFAYVDLPGDFANFSNGLTIEFEGHFGNNATWFERIFDFAADPPSGVALKDSIFVSRFESRNELALGLYSYATGSNVLVGHCHTATNETAITPTPTFQKWLITVDSSGLCRIYRNGVELGTRIEGPSSPLSTSSLLASPTGSAFSVPRLASRPFAFLGRSSWPTDPDLEGAIRYLRIYNQALTPQQAAANATATVTFDANGGVGSMAPQSSTVSATLSPNTLGRTFHTFLGWNTEADGTGVAYANRASYAFASSITLYAQWELIENSLPLPLVTLPVTTTAPPTTVPESTDPPATTTPPTPTPEPVTDNLGVLRELAAGATLVTEGGEEVSVEVVVEPAGAIALKNDEFEVRIDGAPSGSTIELEPGGTVRVSGFGFKPGSQVDVWLFSDPTYLGSLPVAADGTFDGSLPVPALPDGEHTLQANGISSDGQVRSTNVGVVIRNALAPNPVIDTLPSTGSTPGTSLVIVVTVSALGVLALMVRRRSGPQHPAQLEG